MASQGHDVWPPAVFFEDGWVSSTHNRGSNGQRPNEHSQTAILPHGAGLAHHEVRGRDYSDYGRASIRNTSDEIDGFKRHSRRQSKLHLLVRCRSGNDTVSGRT